MLLDKPKFSLRDIMNYINHFSALYQLYLKQSCTLMILKKKRNNNQLIKWYVPLACLRPWRHCSTQPLKWLREVLGQKNFKWGLRFIMSRRLYFGLSHNISNFNQHILGLFFLLLYFALLICKLFYYFFIFQNSFFSIRNPIQILSASQFYLRPPIWVLCLKDLQWDMTVIQSCQNIL